METEDIITTEETEQLEEEQTAIIPAEEAEDQALVEGIILPTFDDMTDQTVLGYVREVFRGFTFDSTENFGKRFADIPQLVNYVTASMEDIRTCRHNAETGALLHSAAAMARFWYMGSTLNKALKEGSYGTGARNKLAAALHKSVSYIYQISSVADRLTVTDCYLLGMRGCDSTMLRRLAQIKDDNIRKGIITAFVEQFTDTSDRNKIEQARKALMNAIKVNQNPDFLSEITSDATVEGASDVFITQEYQETMNQLQCWKKYLKNIANEDLVESSIDTMGMFYISESLPEADKHLQEVKSQVEAVLALVKTAQANLTDLQMELKSLSLLEVTKNETSKRKAGE